MLVPNSWFSDTTTPVAQSSTAGPRDDADVGADVSIGRTRSGRRLPCNVAGDELTLPHNDLNITYMNNAANRNSRENN